MNSTLNTKVSAWRNCKATSGAKPVTLLEWLNTDKWAAAVQKVRAAETEAEQKALKLRLPCITPSGLFDEAHSADALIQHSGFIAFDIDAKANPDIDDWQALKANIANIKQVAYCGLSVSGAGLWGLIPIAHTKHHKKHFEAMEAKFAESGIVLDKGCKDISRLRYYSWDPDGYFNEDATPFKLITKPKPKRKSTPPKSYTGSKDVFERARTHVNNKGYTFTHGLDMHNSIFQLCSFLNFKGIPQREAENWINSNVFPLSDINSNCITAPYKRYVSNHGAGADNAATAKFEGVDMRTGEVLDKTPSPSSWDDIQLPEPGSQEYKEATRAMVNDASAEELQEFYNL
jgi:hypothetical protein